MTMSISSAAVVDGVAASASLTARLRPREGGGDGCDVMPDARSARTPAAGRP
jgi:hypothetical protein